MRITSINTFNNFTSKYKSTFRDEELFDETRDRINSGYSSYDGYATTCEDLIDNNTDFYYPNTYDLRFPNRKQLTDYINLYGQVDNPVCVIEKNPEIYDLCVVDDKNKLSGSLYNYLLTKTEKYSINQIKSVVNSSKLYYADSQAHVDDDLLDYGFMFLKKFKDSRIEDIEDLMNSLVAKNSLGDEIFVKEAANFIQDVPAYKQTAKDYVKAIEAGMVCNNDGVFQGFNYSKASDALFKKYS